MLAAEETSSTLDAETAREMVRERAAQLRAVLERSGPQTRAALASLLVGKLDAEPVIVNGQHGYHLKGYVNIAGILPDVRTFT